MMTRTLASTRGFSLIEVLISMAIMFIIGGALISILLGQMQLTSTHNRNIINQEDVRDVVTFMGEELSLTGTAAAEPFISVADPTEVCFVADIDGNGVPDQVRYSLNGGALMRTLYGTNDGGLTYDEISSDVIMPNVAALEFTYYGAGNATSPDVDEVTSIEIKLTMDIDATATAVTTGKLAAQQQMTRVTLRNRLL
jgi:prepilin-type N-terminal cleavage/methylation domain-containing protein